jgi:hypothetical protein
MKNTFTIKIKVPGKSPKYIPNCTIYLGKIAQVSKKGQEILGRRGNV